FKAFGGRFADPSLLALPTVVNSRANSTDFYINENVAGWLGFDPSQPPGPYSVDVDGNGTIEDHVFYTTFGGPGGASFAHNGRLTMTSVVEYSTSYERELGPAAAASLTLVRRKSHDIIEDECSSPVPGACDPLDPNFAPVYVIDNIGALKRNYYGAELRFRTTWKKLYLVS